MFKGLNEKQEKEIEELNSRSDFFFFFADLELVEKNDYRRKCRLLSDELSQKLHSIYSASQTGYVPPLKFIDFKLGIYDLTNSCLFPNEDYQYGKFRLLNSNYLWLLKLNKMSIQNSEVLPDGTLRLNFEVKLTCAVTTFTYQASSLHKEDRFTENKGHESYSAYKSALQAIENTIQKGNIDFTTLAESMLFLGESYIYGRPIDCFCNSPEEMAPDRIAKYYQTHLRKCIWRPDRINDFKDQQIELISRIITQFNAYKDSTIKKIIKSANQQNITEAELNNTRPNWQNHLKSLTNREAITNYQTTQIEEDIKKLVSAKTKSEAERQQAEAAAQANAQQEEERLKKEQEEQAKKEAEEKKKQESETKKQTEEQAKQQELSQKRDQAITEITIVLHQEPPLTNNELSLQYQNWESQINQLTDLQKITNLQDRILADIQARRQDKITAQEVKENLKKAQSGTKEEQQQAWENLEKQETEKGFQDNQEQINNLKKDKATEDPNKYSQEAKENIEKKLKEKDIKKDELSPENQQELKRLENEEIADPDQLVATETKIKQNIYQEEAKKKIANFTSRVKQVLKLKNKSQIATLKKELLAFISSSNIYYSSQKSVAENLLAQLENYSTSSDNQNNSATKPNNFSWKIIIPLLLIGVLLIVSVIVARRVIARKRKEVKR